MSVEYLFTATSLPRFLLGLLLRGFLPRVLVRRGVANQPADHLLGVGGVQRVFGECSGGV